MTNSPLSEYELLRQRNIEEFKAQFKKAFGEDAFDTKQEPIYQPKPTKVATKKRLFKKKKLSLEPVRRSARISERKEADSETDYDSDDYDYETLGFRGFTSGFRGFKDEKKALDSEFIWDGESSEDSDGARSYSGRERKTRTYTPRIALRSMRDVPQPEDITDSDLENIMYYSAGKAYDERTGTTCHQCRQKTKDTKSVCRGKSCSGVRGQFCGFCLEKRYGEDVAVVLKDPNWLCPPCRNICNCSICRRRKGKLPTGILAPHVLENGYTSVKEFLESKEKPF